MKSEYRGETLWLTQVSASGKTYYITSDSYRQTYFLWSGEKKTKYTASDPTDLYKYMK